MTDFLDFFWLMLWAFLWIIWIMLLFRVFADIFSSDQSGFAKAMWVIFVIVFPFLGILIYLIAQGGNMATREVAAAQAAEAATQDYIRSVAGGSAAELEKLAALHEKGVLTDEEFASQKAKVLA